MKVLFLTPWYPNKFDAMSGLFVRKHAQAAARQGLDVHVLYVCQNKSAKSLSIEEMEEHGVKETILYTRESHSALEELCSIKKAWRLWHGKYGLPDIVHLNVITKIGLLPLMLKARYKIPYVITEHWSGYLPANGDYKGLFRKQLSKIIAKHSNCIMPVSEMLKDAMQNMGIRHDKYKVVYNVIDDFFYDHAPERTNNDKFRFLHVSCFDNRAKNTEGIVEAVELLSHKRDDFEMIMVGTGADIGETKETAEKYGLIERNIVRFTGEQTPEEVKTWMDASDCFVLFSNYETAGIVLEEAAACGLPIISTPVGIAANIVDENTGRLVDAGDAEMLSEIMEYMIESIEKYSRDKIRSRGKIYSFDAVGEQLLEIYGDNGR